MEISRAQSFPDLWLADLLSSKPAHQGGILRRKVRDVERINGMDRLLRELSKRGLQAVRNGETLVIFCNQNPIKRVL